MVTVMLLASILADIAVGGLAYKTVKVLQELVNDHEKRILKLEAK